MCIEDTFCNNPEGLQLKDPKQVFSCEYCKSFRELFYRITPVAAFEVSFSIRKELKKRKDNGKVAFPLVSLFHIQIQEPASKSSTMRTFVFLVKFAEFYYHKIFDARSQWELEHLCDERSPCGISITGEVPYGLLSRSCFYCPDLITVAL